MQNKTVIYFYSCNSIVGSLWSTNKNPFATCLEISALTICRLLACERWPFIVQKTAFWKAKGRLLQTDCAHHMIHVAFSCYFKKCQRLTSCGLRLRPRACLTAVFLPERQAVQYVPTSARPSYPSLTHTLRRWHRSRKNCQTLTSLWSYSCIWRICTSIRCGWRGCPSCWRGQRWKRKMDIRKLR